MFVMMNILYGELDMTEPIKTRTNSTFFQLLGKILLPLIGWKVEGNVPSIKKFVLIVAPHTSNWDLPIGLICAHALGLLANRRYGFMAKASVFRGPFDSLMKWLGGIPIQRDAAQEIVQQFVDIFNQSDELMLVITPEGTRKHRPYWKSGFYRIALKANVPIVMAYLDYKRHAAGVGPTLMPTGFISEDLEVIRKFFSTVTAKFPGSVGKIDFNMDEMMR